MGISLNGVALAVTMLAKKRGFDPEVAAMTGVLHDLHAYKTGSYGEFLKDADVKSHILHDPTKAIKDIL